MTYKHKPTPLTAAKFMRQGSNSEGHERYTCHTHCGIAYLLYMPAHKDKSGKEHNDVWRVEFDVNWDGFRKCYRERNDYATSDEAMVWLNIQFRKAHQYAMELPRWHLVAALYNLSADHTQPHRPRSVEDVKEMFEGYDPLAVSAWRVADGLLHDERTMKSITRR